MKVARLMLPKSQWDFHILTVRIITGLSVVVCLLLLTLIPVSSVAQVVTTTLLAGGSPRALELKPLTDKTYATNNELPSAAPRQFLPQLRLPSLRTVPQRIRRRRRKATESFHSALRPTRGRRTSAWGSSREAAASPFFDRLGGSANPDEAGRSREQNRTHGGS